MDGNAKTRPYRKKKRARREEETRERITDAVVELHRTVGPANTTVTEVAERAGVSRMTVYNHFPTESDLIEACSTHWALQNPFPDPDAWASEEDPEARLRDALLELYAWYRSTEDMMGKVLRDAPLVDALDQIMRERWWPYVDRVVQTLGSGWKTGAHSSSSPDVPPLPSPGLNAALRVAVDFHTWRLLNRSGLTDDDAAELMTRWIACEGEGEE